MQSVLVHREREEEGVQCFCAEGGGQGRGLSGSWSGTDLCEHPGMPQETVIKGSQVSEARVCCNFHSSVHHLCWKMHLISLLLWTLSS